MSQTTESTKGETLGFSPAMMAILGQLANDSKLSIEETLRDAIALYRVATNALKRARASASPIRPTLSRSTFLFSLPCQRIRCE